MADGVADRRGRDTVGDKVEEGAIDDVSWQLVAALFALSPMTINFTEAIRMIVVRKCQKS